MNRFITLCKQDLLLSYRNGVVLVNVIILAIMCALIWLLPPSFEVETAEYFYDASEDNAVAEYLRQAGAAETTLVESRQALQAALSDANRAIGVIYEGSVSDPQFTIISAGQIATENINLMEATLESVIAALQGQPQPDNFRVERLRPAGEPIPLNLNIVPVALVFEVVLLGYLFGAVMIFEEKQEGVNRAYRVSPATTLDYIGSKTVLFTLMSLIYGGLVLLAAFGLGADYGRILPVVILTSSFMTFIGLAIAVFFNNISEWFFLGLLGLVANMVPFFSYAIPAFAPQWVTWIPSYPVLFGVREILFPTGKTGFYGPLLLLLLALNVVTFALCYLAVERKLMRSG